VLWIWSYSHRIEIPDRSFHRTIEHFPPVGDFFTRFEFNNAVHKSIFSKGSQSPCAKGIIHLVQKNPPLSLVVAYGHKTCLMVRSAIKFRFPQFDSFASNFSIKGVRIIRSNDLCRIGRRCIPGGNRPLIKHVYGSVSIPSPWLSDESPYLSR